jgi:hypothetical protein
MRTNHEHASGLADSEDLRRDLPPAAAPVAFIEAGRWQCVWPIDPVETPGHARMLCCGAPIAAGLPYCAAHAARSRRETPPILIAPATAPAPIPRFAA